MVRNAAATGHAPILAAEQDLSAQITALAASVDQLGKQLVALGEQVADQG